MRRGLSLSIVFAASCAIACAGAVAPPRAASAPPPRGLRSTAEALVLVDSDVPAGYLLADDGPMTAEAIAKGLGITTGAVKERGASGYARIFKDPRLPFSCCVVDSILITALDEGAARAVFADFLRTALALGSTALDVDERIGSDSRALEFHHAGSEEPLTTVTLLFSYANAVDAVEITGVAGSFAPADVVAVARKQLERLRADAERAR